MNWQKELHSLIQNSCTDSDIEDFISMHSNIEARDIWNYVYEQVSPIKCKGCKHIQMQVQSGYPCTMCSRRVEVKDFYESR